MIFVRLAIGSTFSAPPPPEHLAGVHVEHQPRARRLPQAERERRRRRRAGTSGAARPGSTAAARCSACVGRRGRGASRRRTASRRRPAAGAEAPVAAAGGSCREREPKRNTRRPRPRPAPAAAAAGATPATRAALRTPRRLRAAALEHGAPAGHARRAVAGHGRRAGCAHRRAPLPRRLMGPIRDRPHDPEDQRSKHHQREIPLPAVRATSRMVASASDDDQRQAGPSTSYEPSVHGYAPLGVVVLVNVVGEQLDRQPGRKRSRRCARSRPPRRPRSPAAATGPPAPKAI